VRASRARGPPAEKTTQWSKRSGASPSKRRSVPPQPISMSSLWRPDRGCEGRRGGSGRTGTASSRLSTTFRSSSRPPRRITPGIHFVEMLLVLKVSMLTQTRRIDERQLSFVDQPLEGLLNQLSPGRMYSKMDRCMTKNRR